MYAPHSIQLTHLQSNIVITVAIVISTTLVIRLSDIMDLQYCFLLIGGLVLVTLPVLAVGISDVQHRKNSTEK